MNTPWPHQVATGQIIKYNVVADLQNVTGAAFTLSYPDNLTLSGIETLPGVFTSESVDTSTTGKLEYVGYNQASGGNPVEVESGSGIVLFTASFTATPTGSGTLTFSEDGFSMMPPSGPSNLVYTNSRTDGSVSPRPARDRWPGPTQSVTARLHLTVNNQTAAVRSAQQLHYSANRNSQLLGWRQL